MSFKLLIRLSGMKYYLNILVSITGSRNRQVFSIMHNAEMSLIDVTYFSKFVMKLIQDCDDFEESIQSILS
jgi:hypothetical protein